MLFGVIFDKAFIKTKIDIPEPEISLLLGLIENYSCVSINQRLINADPKKLDLSEQGIGNFDFNLFNKLKLGVCNIIKTQYQKINILSMQDETQFPEMNKIHYQTKFNPIDNDDLQANIISTDNLSFNELQNLMKTYIAIDEQQKLLREIDNDFQMLCRGIYSLDELIDSEVRSKIDLIFGTKDLGTLPNNDDETIIEALMERNQIDVINSNIRDYLVVINKGTDHAEITNNRYDIFYRFDTFEVSFVIANETNI
jgi:hypothetical protein